MSISEMGHGSIDLDEAARQLEQAAHDAQVAYDCISLGDLDWAHTNAVTARAEAEDRKSTRLNSSHQIISYAVFCLKKKKTIPTQHFRNLIHSSLPSARLHVQVARRSHPA